MHRLFTEERTVIGIIVPIVAAFIGIIPWLSSNAQNARLHIESVQIDNSALTDASREVGFWDITSGETAENEIKYFEEYGDVDVLEASFYQIIWRFNKARFDPDKALSPELYSTLRGASDEVSEPVIVVTVRNSGSRVATLDAIGYRVLFWQASGAGGGHHLVPIVSPDNPITLSPTANDTANIFPKAVLRPDESISLSVPIQSAEYASPETDVHVLFELSIEHHDGEKQATSLIGHFSHWLGGSSCLNLELGQCFPT